MGERLGSYDGLVVCHGCPTIDAAILDQAPGLKIIGELEGDRFASRIDVEAAWTRGVCTVDTTNGSSYPVSEWALALILISLRNAGAQFRRLIAGDVSSRPQSDFGFIHGDLTGKRVGLIGCGHIGRRLIQFLRPFQTEVWVYRSLSSAGDGRRRRLPQNFAGQRDVPVRRHRLSSPAHPAHRAHDWPTRARSDPAGRSIRQCVAW